LGQDQQRRRVEDDDVFHPLGEVECGPKLEVFGFEATAYDLDDRFRTHRQGRVLFAVIGLATKNGNVGTFEPSRELHVHAERVRARASPGVVTSTRGARDALNGFLMAIDGLGLPDRKAVDDLETNAQLGGRSQGLCVEPHGESVAQRVRCSKRRYQSR
jgi:hypothetical protein